MRGLRNILGNRIGAVAVLAALVLNHPAIGADMVGKTAPALTAVDLEQQPAGLAALHGHAVLVMFWATWCGPCRKEMPVVQAAYEKFRDRGFAVIAVNVSDDRKDVERFVEKMGVKFPVVLDPDGDTAERFGVVALPTSYVIDAVGTVREEILGGDLNAARLKDIVSKYGGERR
jgi:cytochrome c biogenesis protein CcmG/thiol:disulfide interchange protein DsbE